MGVARLYTATTPYNEEELFAISYEQSADVVYMAHWDHDPGKLSRYDHDDWRFTTLTFGPDLEAPAGLAVTTNDVETDGGLWSPQVHRYKVAAISEATDQETLPCTAVAADTNDLSYAANTNVLNWTALTGAQRYVVYKEYNGIYGYIGGTEGTTFTDDNISPDLSDTPQLQRNPFATPDDCPGAVTFHEQRLVFGRTRARPNGIWTSQSANFENFNVSRPSKANDAISFAIVGRQVNFVQSLVPAKDLITLTVGAVYQVNGGNSDFMTPAATVPRLAVARGANNVRPLMIDEVVFYLQSRGSKVRTLGYTFEVDGYKGNDITVYARHFFNNLTIVDWCYCEEPNSTVWCVRSDGQLIALTWIQEQEIWGWTLCDVGGIVESVCSVSEGNEDYLYLLVQRTINGETKRYVERMASTQWERAELAMYLDCARSYGSTTAITEVHGFGHLEGETVNALVDGNVVSGLTVTGGIVTLPNAGYLIHIGLPFEQLIETLPITGNAPGVGSVVGRRKLAAKAIISAVSTRGIEVGVSETEMYDAKQRDQEVLGAPTDLFTGNYELALPPAWNDAGTVIIRQTDPLPMTITGVFPDTEMGE